MARIIYLLSCILLSLSSGTTSLQAVPIVLTLTAVELRTFYDVQDDSGTPYPRPQWSTSVNYPLTQPMGMNLNAFVGCNISPSNASGTVWIKGSGSGMSYPPTPYNVTTGGFGYFPISSSTTLPSYVATMNLDITWQYSLDGINYLPLGPTHNILYLTLDYPLSEFWPPQIPVLYHSVLKNACSVVGASNEVQQIANLWQAFQGQVVQNINGLYLFYYGYRPWGANQTDLFGMLNANLKSGTCGAWQDFFVSCLLAHGITDYSRILVKVSNAFNEDDFFYFVKNWSASSSHGTLARPYWAVTDTDDVECFEMWPRPSPSYVPSDYLGTYGDLTSNSGLPGKGMATPTEKVFWDHAIVLIDTLYSPIIYLDPSYGTTYVSANDMEAQTIAFLGPSAYPASYNDPRFTRYLISDTHASYGWGSLMFFNY